MARSPNLAHALTILARADMVEHALHADIGAFGAPSECHTLVSRGEIQRKRRARKHAECVARRPLRVIQRQALALGIELYSPYNRVWSALCDRIYRKIAPFDYPAKPCYTCVSLYP